MNITLSRSLLLLYPLALFLLTGCPAADDDDSAIGDDDDTAADDDDSTGDDDDSTGDDDDSTGDDDDSAGDDDDSAAGDDDDSAAAFVPTYEFDSWYEAGESSVSNSGQMFRQVLISNIKAYVGDLTGKIDAPNSTFDESTVAAELNAHYNWNGDLLANPHGISTTPAPSQTLYSDIHSSGKSLSGKIAGAASEESTQQCDWTTCFKGWDATGITNPDSLVQAWFDELQAAAVAWDAGTYAQDPDNNAVSGVHKTAGGHDLQQLLQKFLMGAVSFNQAADDYMDDATAGKGLLADNTAAVSGKPYTALEHAWDEGFGYYGASRNNDAYTDAEVKASWCNDENGDGAIDLKKECNWAHSVNAAKRDIGSAGGAAPTDFSAGAFDAFVAGRTLIHTANGALTTAQMSELETHRTNAINNWERAIASTVVHYINDTLGDMAKFGVTGQANADDNYSFDDHTKHWSELKGFALSLQFNPYSDLSDTDFEQLHTYIGMAPVLDNATQAEKDAYETALGNAKTLLGQAYGFNAANLAAW